MIKLYVNYGPEHPDNSELTLFKESATLSLQEIFEEFALAWPPKQLIIKVGKRGWYELCELK